MGRAALLIGALSVLCDCAATKPPRVVDQLKGFDGLVVSTSIAALEAPDPSDTEAGLGIDYPLLFENAGQRDVSVELSSAGFLIGTERGVASCRVGSSRPRALLLRPGDRWRVDCALFVPRERLFAALARDVEAWLSIPVRSPRGQAMLRFGYGLRVEDAT